MKNSQENKCNSLLDRVTTDLKYFGWILPLWSPSESTTWLLDS